MGKSGIVGTAVLFLGLAQGAAQAQDASSCKAVRLSDPGWADITSTNALSSAVLEGLGYAPSVKDLSVPITFQALKNKEIDVFLGNWMPAQQKFLTALQASKAVDVLHKNLEGAKFTLAVPDYVADGGVHDVKDLATHAAKFKSEIYGIASGAPANANIQRMIGDSTYGLKDWKLVESSEAGMLGQVARDERSKNWIVFLAWAPHPMNTHFKITYLSGADQYFGPNYGGAEVYTLTSTAYAARCPNVAKLFSNLTFNVEMEGQIMSSLENSSGTPTAAASAYLKAHPDLLNSWLAGVTTLDGKPGLPAVKAKLNL